MQLSAGIVPFRRTPDLEVLVAHPGGPYFAKRDKGWWTVVKGAVEPGEPTQEAAIREFREETGWDLPDDEMIDLGQITQKSGKRVRAWAIEAEFDPDALEPGVFEMRWLGRLREFPEIDRVAWMTIPIVVEYLLPAQVPLIERLAEIA